MSKISIEGNASGTGTLTIAAPNTNTNRTLNLPDASGTMVITGGAQTIEFAAGTAGAPSITTTGDINTGIFFPAADTIGFAEGGAEAMRINSSGNVGIGTTSPSYKLDIVANSDAIGASVRGRSSDNIGIYNFTSNDGATQYGYILGSSAELRVAQNGANYITAYTNGAERARITSAGLFQFNSGYGSVATAYGCRAWVNFNGTGTPAIRASGNVSSITDNNTGDYTVNITTALPDADYCPVTTIKPQSGASSTNGKVANIRYNQNLTTTTCRVFCNSTAGAEDYDIISVAIFR